MCCGQRVLDMYRWLLSLAPVPQPWWAGRFSGWSILWVPVQGSSPLQRAWLHSYGNLPKCIIDECLSNLTMHKYNLESILKCRFLGSLCRFWSSSSEVARLRFCISIKLTGTVDQGSVWIQMTKTPSPSLKQPETQEVFPRLKEVPQSHWVTQQKWMGGGHLPSFG